MHFGEYELFPSLISLSPLPTTHPKTFQRQPVRSSTPCQWSFNLVMGRSPGFASTPTNLIALFRLAFAAPPYLKYLSLLVRSNSQAHYAKGTPSHRSAPTACKRTVSGSFHSLFQGSFHLSFTVLVHYRSLGSIQPQLMVQLYSDRISPVPPYSFHLYISSLTGLSPSMVMIPIMFYSLYIDFRAFPRSLATTCGITNCSPFLQVLRCFSSLGFLCLRNHISSKCGVSPFGHLWIKGCLHLPIAFRSLPRPSSSPRAQAFAIRSYSLPTLSI